MTATAVVSGFCAPEYLGVKAAFVDNFDTHSDVGASVCIVAGGIVVVDLWGGYADAARNKPWQKDTVVNIWSSTKGVNATCFAMLVDRGVITYDDKVTQWWPEFGASGKVDITIGALLSHQAGLSGFDTTAGIDDLYDNDVASARLAAQAPIWAPGSASGYHAITIGILANTLFNRITGRTIKQFVTEEISGPLGLELTIGLATGDEQRAAEMIAPSDLSTDATGEMNAAQIAALTRPVLDPLLPNTSAWRSAELPSANGFSNARALAKLYAALIDRTRPLIRPETLAKATTVRISGVDLVLDLYARWGAGFLINSEELYGPNPRSFGHSGWGGSLAFADPDAGIAVAYTMNKMSALLRGDPRGGALIGAVYEVYEKTYSGRCC